MRILLIESSDGVGAGAATALGADGHDIVRCHEPGAPSFPCHAVEEPGGCPLTSTPTVDCAVVVHGGAPDAVTASEAGVSCALRLGVPVVARHDGPGSPFTGWAVPVAGDEVGAACELAVSAARAHEARPLVAEVQRLLADAGGSTEGVWVEVLRGDERTLLRVTVPKGAPLSPGVIATRVHARYGEGLHPVTESRIDVEVVEA